MHQRIGLKTAGDAMTDQLNREELARIQGGPAGADAAGVFREPIWQVGATEIRSP